MALSISHGSTRRATKTPRVREKVLEVTRPSHRRDDTSVGEPPPAALAAHHTTHSILVDLAHSSSLQAVTPCSFHRAGMLSKHDNLGKLWTYPQPTFMCKFISKRGSAWTRRCSDFEGLCWTSPCRVGNTASEEGLG